MSYKVKDDFPVRKEKEFRLTYFDRHSELTALRPKNNRHFRFSVTAEQVLRAFNTRAFKREQPDNPDVMLRIISEALANNLPVPFVMYWGKGLRPFDEPETVCLDFLFNMVGRVSKIYAPGAHVTLIFTDTHARLNGHSEQSILAYFQDLTVAAGQHGFEILLLSELMLAVDVTEQDHSKSLPSAELFSMLCASAAKWFRGKGTIEQGAIKYYQTNMLEKQVVERAFPDSIFVTFSGKDLRPLFPDHLPIFYMYSLRHGVCDKPWFLPADFMALNRAPAVPRREFSHGG